MSARPPHQSQPHQSHPSIRRCVVCRETAPKPDLLRIVRRPDGEIMLSARDHGRGAYVHPHPQCLSTAAAQPRHLSRALRRPPPDTILDQLNWFAEAQPA